MHKFICYDKYLWKIWCSFISLKLPIIKRGIKMSEVSKEKLEKVMQPILDWQTEFEQTKEYAQLLDATKEISGSIIYTFAKVQYTEFSRDAKKWTAGSLEEVLVDYFPAEFILAADDFKQIEQVLEAYFTFLEMTNKIKNAPTLLKRVKKVAPEMIERAANPVNWSPAKKAEMEAVIKTSQPEAPTAKEPVRRMTNRRPAPPVKQQPVLSTKIGRNQPCPCGSGKKYKKCCGA